MIINMPYVIIARSTCTWCPVSCCWSCRIPRMVPPLAIAIQRSREAEFASVARHARHSSNSKGLQRQISWRLFSPFRRGDFSVPSWSKLHLASCSNWSLPKNGGQVARKFVRSEFFSRPRQPVGAMHFFWMTSFSFPALRRPVRPSGSPSSRYWTRRCASAVGGRSERSGSQGDQPTYLPTNLSINLVGKTWKNNGIPVMVDHCCNML